MPGRLLICPEVDGTNAPMVGMMRNGPEARQLYVDANEACRKRLVAQGVDLGGYNTTESATDFAELRLALGIAEWNVLGVSYGTDLALTYMRQHPEGVRSVLSIRCCQTSWRRSPCSGRCSAKASTLSSRRAPLTRPAMCAIPIRWERWPLWCGSTRRRRTASASRRFWFLATSRSRRRAGRRRGRRRRDRLLGGRRQ